MQFIQSLGDKLGLKISSGQHKNTIIVQIGYILFMYTQLKFRLFLGKKDSISYVLYCTIQTLLSLTIFYVNPVFGKHD
jgi:hypothetical protein